MKLSTSPQLSLYLGKLPRFINMELGKAAASNGNRMSLSQYVRMAIHEQLVKTCPEYREYLRTLEELKSFEQEG